MSGVGIALVGVLLLVMAVNGTTGRVISAAMGKGAGAGTGTPPAPTPNPNPETAGPPGGSPQYGGGGALAYVPPGQPGSNTQLW